VQQINLPFVTWRELPPLHDGAKPRKVPSSPVTGEPVDPHDRSGWMAAEAAHGAVLARPDLNLRIGQVLSDSDPYFMLDLDDCHDGSDWSEGAKRIVAAFPGAAVEVSINGRGLHIIAQCNPAALGERRNKFDYLGVACEFYHTGRFIALGHGFSGNPDIDFTATLASIVPTREIHESLSLIDQADPEWSGPEDDDTLINLMLNARGSVESLFNGKASVSDLWNANVEALARTWPSSAGDDFDRSSADAALMSHLAFWTGKNTDRMDRLFRRSKLMRDKYERRPDYRTATISGAVGHTTNVYKQSKKLTAQKTAETDLQTSATVPPEGTYGEIMSIDEQEGYFAGCVYVARDHAVLVPDGRLLKPAQFRTIYGGHVFLMSSDGTKPTQNAFEAFTENRVVRFPKVNRTRFKPGMPFGSPVGADGVNCYMPATIRTVSGDVSRLLWLLEKQLPDERDRAILMSWCAALIQNPGRKFFWAPVMQGTKGNGKSLWAEILTQCVGEEYCWTPPASKIDAKFNSFLARRLFINVEEMNMFSKYETLEALKEYITGRKQEVENKGVDSAMDPDYCANWYFATNHKDAIIKEHDDRRFSIFFTAQQSRPDMIRDGMATDHFFPKLYRWLEQDGFSFMRHYLENYSVPTEFNPAENCIWAPDTSSTIDAVSWSSGVPEQHIQEAIEMSAPGFCGGWLSTTRVSKLLTDAGIKKSPRKLQGVIENMGYELRCRASRPLMQEDMTRPRLYALPGVNGAVEEYEKAQGYM
jgi:hypothetical protein